MSEAILSAGGVRAYGSLVLRCRWLVIIIALAVALSAGYGVRFLTFDPDSRLFFGEDNPERLALEAMENTYTRANNIVFVLAPKDGEVFTPATLEAVAWLTERGWHVPYSSRVSSIINDQHSYAVGDEVVVEELVPDPRAMSPADLARAREIALGRVDLIGRLIAPDADVTAVTVLTNAPRQSRAEVPEMAGFARALVDEFRTRFPEIDIYLSGGVIADMTFADAGRRDMVTLVPVMVLLIALALAIGLRSIYATLATGLVILCSLATALGLAGWAGLVLNPGSAGAPITIMTLSLANCVHVIIGTGQQRRAGLGREAAVVEALRINAAPVTITSLTTAVGFLTLNFSASPPLRDLGNLVALGMVAAFLYSFTLLPAVLAMLPLRAGAEARFRGERQALRRLADTVVAWRRPLLALGAITIVGLAAGITRITLDDDFIRYFDESFEYRTDTDFLQERLTGLNVLQYSIPSGEEQGIARPDYLETLDAFAEWFRQQDKVAHVSTIADTLKRLNRNMHGDDPRHDRVPDSRELAAQYLLFYEMSLPFGHDLNSQIDVARSASRVTVFLANVSSAEVRELGARGEAWLREHAPAMAAPATGLSMMYAYVSERNIRSMLLGTGVALVLISLILLVVLRSPRIGLISLAPNLVPALMAFGLWGYLYGEVNLAVSVVGAMTLGIVVDDTVHLLARYLRARRELGLEPADAIRHGFESVGVALILTSAALVLGFGVLASSGFAVSSQMGLLCALTIAFALLADFLALPPLILALDRRRR